MSIIQFATDETEGAYCDLYWSGQRCTSRPDPVTGEYKTMTPIEAGSPVVLVEKHIGLVIAKREANHYDDSDFYALVWDEEKQDTEEICYASTRGWTYPCTASIDATPDVLAKVAVIETKRRQAQIAAKAAQDAATPTVGKTVVVTKKTMKVAKGVRGKVFWFGQDQFRSRYDNGLRPHHFGLYDPTGALAKRGCRVGLELEDGTKVFLSAANVDVVAEPLPE